MTLFYSDEMIIEGLRQKKSSCIMWIYEEFGPIVRHLVRLNSGTQQDMEDLLQDAIIVLYSRCLEESFRLECSLKTYFVAICKNLWLQRLERKFRLLYVADYVVNESSVDYSADDQKLREDNLELIRMLYKNLSMLPVDCQRLIRLFCLKVPFREIARLMKYKDDVYVKTRKYSCKNLLRKKILNDPDYYLFIEYEKYFHHKRLD